MNRVILRGIISANSRIKNGLYEKLKKRAINKRLTETNKSKYCLDHKIKWKLGLSAYWLEIEKINQESELQNVKTK